MSVEQFGRACVLSVGKGSSGIVIERLRMTFDITKSSDSKANQAKIEVYNLNPDNQTRLLKEWEDIRLIAGYTGHERLIFTGQVRSATPKVSDTDIIITIESGDGDKPLLKGFINKTLARGCTADDVVSSCRSSMGKVPPAHIDSLDGSYGRGKVLSGRASDILDKQTRHSDAQWSIQDGQLMVLKGNNVRPNATWLISPETGMIGSPEPTTKGVKVKTLLNPAYMIGGKAKIDSAIYQGTIRIEKINHKGDTHGDQWYSELEGVTL